MLNISIITLFPEVMMPFLNHSIIKRAVDKKAVSFNLIDPRLFTSDKHRTVDDRPFGGGAGMLMKLEPLVAAIEEVERRSGPAFKVLLTPKGKLWNQNMARQWVRDLPKKSHPIAGHLLLICGHYEGVDARIGHYIDEEISIGNFVLSGGEAAAVVVVDTLVRLLPGVLKKEEASVEETFMQLKKKELYELTGDRSVLDLPGDEVTLLEYPQFTRPEEFRGHKVPEVLLSGDHQEIKIWRIKKAWEETKKSRS